MIGSNHLLSVIPVLKSFRTGFSFIVKSKNTLWTPFSVIYPNLNLLASHLSTDIQRFNFSSSTGKSLSEDVLKIKTSIEKPNLESKLDEKSHVRNQICNIISPSETATANVDHPKILSPGDDHLKLLEKLSNGDAAMLEELKSLQSKINLAASAFGTVVHMNEQKWLELYHSSVVKRKNFITHLVKQALRDQKASEEKKAKRKMREDVNVNDDDDDDEDDDHDDHDHNPDPLTYRLFGNSMFLKFRKGTLRRMLYARAFSAMLYSSDVIFDCSYEPYMTRFETKYLAKQMAETMRVNLHSPSPFNLVFCNFNEDSLFGKYISQYCDLFYHKTWPITLHHGSYLDLFPREKLIYLTSHCKTNLRNFDPEKKYIIGAFCDKTYPKPVSLAKAKRDNIEMAKFPLEKYLDWGIGKKTLTTNHVLEILLSLKNDDNDWNKALEVVPRRFLAPYASRKSSLSMKRHKGSVAAVVNEIFHISD